MDTINWAAMLVALGFGVIVGAVFLAVGMWADRARIARWDRELNSAYAPRDIVNPTLPRRLPQQRETEENDPDGA